ncbi:polysaccharide deacetylase family protein [Simiduia sp. 21SJ11W-1]|uniref:polysaccharide deacetylase family protein n=1 Tax=Simiduia sp. 21SJ11W-1 TaxID=2909669 RepID=UPI00209ECECF|nr:polysaccharide deacetylase family protein [Simiduia sp. 21SJ11W-1]UTA47364.1 polysaccharide deacetylase family protein [Simiduia sp. 21SJ11W-1]
MISKDTLFSAAEALGGFRALRYLTRKREKVLMYHRIIDHPQIPAITPKEFEQQIRYLKRHFNIKPVDQLIQARVQGTSDDNAIAITFDDGHADFYQNAWPILKKYQVPASLYVTTGFIDNQCWLWPDLLRHILWTTANPGLLFNGNQHLSLQNPHRQSTWNTIASHCLSLASDERIAFINNLAHTLNVPTDSPPSTLYKAVTWDNLREMHAAGLEIGSHTVSHRILSTLNSHELTMELRASKQRIEEQMESKINGICYPNGMRKDINQQVEQQAASEGYRYGLVAYPAKTNRNNLFHQGRWAAPKSFTLFKRMVSGISRDGNPQGEHV